MLTRPAADENSKVRSNRLSDGEVEPGQKSEGTNVYASCSIGAKADGCTDLGLPGEGRPKSSHNCRGLAKDAQVNYLWRATISDAPRHPVRP